jgi:hypothetical protein
LIVLILQGRKINSKSIRVMLGDNSQLSPSAKLTSVAGVNLDTETTDMADLRDSSSESLLDDRAIEKAYEECSNTFKPKPYANINLT